jgi:hypothetical protein
MGDRTDDVADRDTEMLAVGQCDPDGDGDCWASWTDVGGEG